jgi:predicted metallo-beta-lactamase superfamily hydrolase
MDCRSLIIEHYHYDFHVSFITHEFHDMLYLSLYSIPHFIFKERFVKAQT